MFDINAPIKKRYIRENQSPFMNKTLQKSVMTRSRLRNKFLKNKTLQIKSKKKKNTVSVFFERKKDSFFDNLDTENITDN